ncbi:progranulin-like [Paramacrobiotus metropolitanus]|uniref:progranulin-like n=1 Tax=Paramacrobiotus metropolitanus TaxID=2943436 RepID=UPI0024456526|nr:progranulin-like [Paramacrobiotus metropolitanus]
MLLIVTFIFTVFLTEAVVLPSQEGIPWKAIKERKFHQAIVCPGGSECPEFATCCMMKSGQWGCCPFPEAVCCTDLVHCCPKNSKCDLTQQRCSSEQYTNEYVLFVPMMEKFLWNTTASAVDSVQCQDHQSECPDGSTCCQMASGEWGCCPFEAAICCSDKLHCCPKDTVCDLEKQRCQKSVNNGFFTRLHWREPVKHSRLAIKPYRNVTENECPDHHPCPDTTTCCQLKSGKYGCCAFAKADCCSDGLHCCPQGSKCDVAGQKCV